MNTLDLVDPEHRPFVSGFPVFNPKHDDLGNFRHSVIEAFTAMAPSALFKGEEHTTQGSADQPDVRILIYRPVGLVRGAPAILYIHGGGFFTGTPDMLDAANQALAEASGALVVAVDYRLAPETPFPGPVEDCYAAFIWMVEQAEMLGIDPARISILGDSAGGALAAALALLVRDRGRASVKAQFLIYPMLDARTGTSEAPVDNPTTGEFIWTQTSNCFGWTSMRGAQEIPDDRLGRFSPALETDLNGLPPAFIAVGSLDLLLDEDADYALRLSRARVPVEFHLYQGAVHGFDRLPGRLGDRFRADLSEAFSRLL